MASYDSKTEKMQSQTILQSLLDGLSEHPEKVALRWFPAGAKESSFWTYEEMIDKIARCATGLRSLGVERGDYVLLMMENRWEFHVVDLAAVVIGAVPVSVYNSSSASQIGKVVSVCHPKVAVVSPVVAGEYEEFQKAGSTLPTVYVGDADNRSEHSFEDLLTSDPVDLESLVPEGKMSDLATLIFTSGTTGDPKAVMLDNSNVAWTAGCLRKLFRPNDDVQARLISYLPMAHVAERTVSHYTSLLSGFEVTCCPDPTLVAEYAPKVKPTILFGVPRVYERIFLKVRENIQGSLFAASGLKGALGRLKERAVLKLASRKIMARIGMDELELAVSGGAPLAPELHEWLLKLGFPLSQIYGLSETTGPMTWAPYQDKVGYVGKPCPGVEVKLLDDGEIACRGGNVFRGYLNNEQLTRDVLSDDGWFITGDIGEFDDDGYLRVVERKKELIVTSGGKNIAPVALENSIKLSPLVAEAMVVGDGRKYVSALITLEPDAVAGWAAARRVKYSSLHELAANKDIQNDISNYISGAMKHFSSPERIKKFKILGDEWPQDSAFVTATGKLRRKVLSAQYADTIETLYR